MNSDSTEGAGMIEALTWLEVNKKRLAIGAVVLLVVGFAIYVWSYMAEQKELKASAALLQLRPSGALTNQTPVPSAEFLKVAQEHQGTAAAERALLLAAGALFTEGKYADAQKAFDDFSHNYSSSPWGYEAAYGVATSLEAQGKREEAVTAYQRVGTAYANSPVANDARTALARIYEAKGQFDLALKQYDDISKGATGSGAMGMMGMNQAAQEAFVRREKIFKAHPELRPAATTGVSTNAPAIAPGALTNSAVIRATNAAAGTNGVSMKAVQNGPVPVAK